MIDLKDYCGECGVEMPLDRYSLRRKFCSKKCYMLDYRRLEREAQIEARRDRPPCRACGGKMDPATRDTTLYCSLSCQHDWLGKRKAKRIHEARIEARRDRPPCRCCGGPIPLTMRKGTVFCKRSCGTKVRKARWRKRARK